MVNPPPNAPRDAYLISQEHESLTKREPRAGPNMWLCAGCQESHDVNENVCLKCRTDSFGRPLEDAEVLRLLQVQTQTTTTKKKAAAEVEK